jgi:hypothetical protein
LAIHSAKQVRALANSESNRGNGVLDAAVWQLAAPDSDVVQQQPAEFELSTRQSKGLDTSKTGATG